MSIIKEQKGTTFYLTRQLRVKPNEYAKLADLEHNFYPRTSFLMVQYVSVPRGGPAVFVTNKELAEQVKAYLNTLE